VNALVAIQAVWIVVALLLQTVSPAIVITLGRVWESALARQKGTTIREEHVGSAMRVARRAVGLLHLSASHVLRRAAF
jgi:hypothetical protein